MKTNEKTDTALTLSPTISQGDDHGVKTAVEGKPAPKVGPRRMLLGMPCVRCRVYLLSEETHCPCCKQAVRTA